MINKDWRDIQLLFYAGDINNSCLLEAEDKVSFMRRDTNIMMLIKNRRHKYKTHGITEHIHVYMYTHGEKQTIEMQMKVLMVMLILIS